MLQTQNAGIAEGRQRQFFSLWQLALSHDVARDNVRLVRGNLISERSRTALFDWFIRLNQTVDGLRDSNLAWLARARQNVVNWVVLVIESSHWVITIWSQVLMCVGLDTKTPLGVLFEWLVTTNACFCSFDARLLKKDRKGVVSIHRTQHSKLELFIKYPLNQTKTTKWYA